jgi:hypothetical protein
MQAANCKNRFIAMSSHANHKDTVEIKELISGLETYNTINDVQVHHVYFLHHLQKNRKAGQKPTYNTPKHVVTPINISVCS